MLVSASIIPIVVVPTQFAPGNATLFAAVEPAACSPITNPKLLAAVMMAILKPAACSPITSPKLLAAVMMAILIVEPQ